MSPKGSKMFVEQSSSRRSSLGKNNLSEDVPLMKTFSIGLQSTIDSLPVLASIGYASDSDDDEGWSDVYSYDAHGAEPQVQENDWGILAMSSFGHDLNEFVGHGCFGVFRRATRRADGNSVLVREFCGRKEEEREQMRKEYSLMRRLNHENIVTASAFFESRYDMWLCMEWCPDGTLHSYIQQHGTLPESTASTLFRQLFSGISFLHSNDVVNRGLSHKNLFLSEGATKLKIADFGMARVVVKVPGTSSKAQVPSTVAAKMRHGCLGRLWSSAFDIVSCGCIMFFMLKGRPLSNCLDLPQTFSGPRLLSEISWDDISTPTKTLMRKCFTVSTQDRPTASELLEHFAVQKIGSAPLSRKLPTPTLSLTWLQSCGLIHSLSDLGENSMRPGHDSAAYIQMQALLDLSLSGLQESSAAVGLCNRMDCLKFPAETSGDADCRRWRAKALSCFFTVPGVQQTPVVEGAEKLLW